MRTLGELGSLEDRVVLVTGGAGHVGRALRAGLRELGARVVSADLPLSGRPEQGLVDEPVDLQDEAATRALVRRVGGAYGQLDVLIHCAAFVGTTRRPGWAVPFEEQTLDAWDAAMRVNVGAAFVLAQEAAPLLRESGRGSMVLVSSIYGLVGPDFRLYKGTSMANPAAYGASKAGLVQLARYLATLLAPQVRVNSVTLGGIARGQPEAFVRRYEQRTPLGRMGTEEDIKGAVAYLASDLSAYVTGHNLIVDGGWTAW